MRKLTVGLGTALVAAALPARTLWPGEDVELHQGGGARLELTNGWMFVETGVQERWPGVRVCFKGQNYDLSPYGELAFSVSNTTDRAVRLCVSVKNRVYQGASPGGAEDLAPHAAGTVRVPLSFSPWRLTEPLELVGMRGCPKAGGGADSFDLSRTSEIHVFFADPKEPSGFALRAVTAAEHGRPVKLLDTKSFLPFVDRFGQFAHDDWPGKIHSEAELAATAEAEERWLREHDDSPIPGADVYGGWALGPRLRATGFFRTEKVNGKWWLVDPEGHLFFSQGIDCVGGDSATGLSHREAYFAELPPDEGETKELYGMGWWAPHGFYAEKGNIPFRTFDFAAWNQLRKYGRHWRHIAAEKVHRRLKAWGMNTIANWSNEQAYALRRTPYTLCLGTDGTPRRAGSNGWWGPLPDPFNPEFERALRERAEQAAAKMKDDPWCLGVFVDNELSWHDLPDLAEVAEQYYATVARVLRETLPNHLYLGNRIAWGGDETYLAAARHCDVVSVNVYADSPWRDLPAGACDKPMINGEFHFGALDRGLFHPGLVPVKDQAERAARYRRYVEAALDHPRMVGTHWFQWRDQPLTGRGDGEDYQIGFLTVADVPYPEMVAAAREVASTMYARRYGGTGAAEAGEQLVNLEPQVGDADGAALPDASAKGGK